MSHNNIKACELHNQSDIKFINLQTHNNGNIATKLPRRLETKRLN